jgi:hypothetical protein
MQKSVIDEFDENAELVSALTAIAMTPKNVVILPSQP